MENSAVDCIIYHLAYVYPKTSLCINKSDISGKENSLNHNAHVCVQLKYTGLGMYLYVLRNYIFY